MHVCDIESKTGKVLSYLMNGNSLTLKDCIKKFRCTSLAQRIQLLKSYGYQFKSTRIRTANKECIARYQLLPVITNFNNLYELKQFIGLVENDSDSREDLKTEIKEFYKKYKI